MKHKHYGMIVAKAANMDLVVFAQDRINGEWYEYGRNGYYCPFDADGNYFLCLPQHKEVCSHWLNDGEVEELNCNDYEHYEPDSMWRINHVFMQHDRTFRIKPKKEKRWVRLSPTGTTLDTLVLFETEIQASFRGCQVIEIEVEV